MVETKLEDTKVTDEQVTVTVTDAKGKTSELSAELLLVATGCASHRRPGLRGHRGQAGPRRVPQSWDTLETDVEGCTRVRRPAAAAVAGPGPRVVRRGHADRRDGRRQPSPPIDYAGIGVTFSTPGWRRSGSPRPRPRAGHEVVVNKFPFNGTAKGLIHGQGGVVKVVAAKDGPVLGIHLVGAEVTELVAEAMLIYNWEALPIDVAQYIHPHPTLSEAVGEAHLTLAGRRHQL